MSDYDKQIAEIYREMELEIIRSMKKNLGLHLAEEQKTGVTYPQWQAIKLKELKKYQRQYRRTVYAHTKRIPKEISEQMQNELQQGSLKEAKKWAKMQKKLGISSFEVSDSFFKIDARKVNAQIDDLNSALREANTAVFRMADDAYREVIFKYSLFASNGVYTEEQAYDAAVKDFLSQGLNCIEYKNGRRVNIASYAQMAVRTASLRAYMTGQGEMRRKLGRTLIRITKHNTSCPLCRPFEKKVLIDDVYSGGTRDDGDYMLLSEAMKQGLYHPNCRHGSSTYFPELEDIYYGYDDEGEKQKSESEKKLEERKMHIESIVQKYRRLSEGSVDKENVEKYRRKESEWKEKLSQVQKELENAENGDIIETQEMFRKKTYSKRIDVKPVSDEVFRGLKLQAEKSGAELFRCDYGDEFYRHLENNYATAACIDDFIIVRPDATISEILEELYHFKQNQTQLNFDKSAHLRTILNEIDAKEYLLSVSKKYSIPRKEIEETTEHLAKYKKELEEFLKGVSYNEDSKG